MEEVIYSMNDGKSKKGKLWFYIVIAMASSYDAKTKTLKINVTKRDDGSETQLRTVWVTKETYALAKVGMKVKLITG